MSLAPGQDSVNFANATASREWCWAVECHQWIDQEDLQVCGSDKECEQEQ